MITLQKDTKVELNQALDYYKQFLVASIWNMSDPVEKKKLQDRLATTNRLTFLCEYIKSVEIDTPSEIVKINTKKYAEEIG